MLFLAVSSLAFAQDLDKTDVKPPIGYTAPTTIEPIWTGYRNEYPADGELTCPANTVPAIIGTADQIHGGTQAQIALDWGRAWAVQPHDWNGDWAYVIMTSTIGESEKSAAIWCVNRASVIEFDAEPVAAEPPPPTTCNIVAGPSLHWDGMEIGETRTRSTTLTWSCNGPNPPYTSVAANLSIPAPAIAEGFSIEGDKRVFLEPNIPKEINVSWKATDVEPHDVTLTANAGSVGIAQVDGEAQARQPVIATPSAGNCVWGKGVSLNFAAATSGWSTSGAVNVWAPVNPGNCGRALHVWGLVGFTPDRDGESYLDDWQDPSVNGVSLSYGLGATYVWAKDSWWKEFGLGGEAQGLRVHPSGFPDAWDILGVVEWTPVHVKNFHFGAVAGVGFFYGFAEPGSAGFGKGIVGGDNTPVTAAGYRWDLDAKGRLQAIYRF